MRKSVLGLAAPVLFLLAPWPEAVRAATLHTLFKSGDAASDGVKLDFFLQPIATSATVVAFRGTTSAVMTKTGATFAVVAKTGDPLPAPLAGTFNTLRDPAINDGGVVVFRANVNSPSAEGGVFLFEAGVLTAIFLETSTVGARRPPDINNNGDVVYTTGAPARAIYLWMHSGGSTTLLVAAGAPSPGGGVFSTFGDHPVVN